MSSSDALPTEQLDFVTIDGLLTYGEQLAQTHRPATICAAAFACLRRPTDDAAQRRRR